MVFSSQARAFLARCLGYLARKIQPPVASVTIAMPFPPGHFYSPIVNPLEIAEARDSIWPSQPRQWPAIDFNPASHREIIERVLARHAEHFDYPEHATAERHQFFTHNSQFSGFDPLLLFSLLREWAPDRVVEVGSGYSSLLMAHVNQEYLDGRCRIECIEPYPRSFLEDSVPGIGRVIPRRVQEMPLAFFEELGQGDVLFIDSSHVVKTGSDVHYLFLDVLPRLASGVRIHVHDIFLPHDYPPKWVLEENRSWNEQYLLQAMLSSTQSFEVLFGSAYAETFFGEDVRKSSRGLSGGGSFWMQKR